MWTSLRCSVGKDSVSVTSFRSCSVVSIQRESPGTPVTRSWISASSITPDGATKSASMMRICSYPVVPSTGSVGSSGSSEARIFST